MFKGKTLQILSAALSLGLAALSLIDGRVKDKQNKEMIKELVEEHFANLDPK